MQTSRSRVAGGGASVLIIRLVAWRTTIESVAKNPVRSAAELGRDGWIVFERRFTFRKPSSAH